MADLADVETTLVGLATNALYPRGLTESSSVGADCRVYRGWPAPAGLDTDLKAGRVNVTVFPDSTPGQTLTRYPSDWQGSPVRPTLSGAVLGNTVTFFGTADFGQIAGIMFGNRSFVYRTVAGDTTGSVAANLAARIRVTQIVGLSGSTLTIPGASNVIVRIVADGPAFREIRRQSHDFRISFWCPSPMLRDSAPSVVDSALAALTFIDLPDTSRGRIAYKNTAVFDQSQSANLYRRDLLYVVEYPTIASISSPAMIFGDLALNTTGISI